MQGIEPRSVGCKVRMLKSLFYKQYFFSECNSDQLPTFFHSLLGGCNSKATAQQQQTTQNWVKKWATGQSCIRKRSTTCRIGTLDHRLWMPDFTIFQTFEPIQIGWLHFGVFSTKLSAPILALWYPKNDISRKEFWK